MNYRIQKRLYSPNVLEKKHIIDGKEHWKVFIMPNRPKAIGDIECDRLLNIYNNFKSKKTCKY